MLILVRPAKREDRSGESMANVIVHLLRDASYESAMARASTMVVRGLTTRHPNAYLGGAIYRVANRRNEREANDKVPVQSVPLRRQGTRSIRVFKERVTRYDLSGVRTIHHVPLMGAPTNVDVNARPHNDAFRYEVLPSAPRRFLRQLRPRNLRTIFQHTQRCLYKVTKGPCLVSVLRVVPLELPFYVNGTVRCVRAVPRRYGCGRRLNGRPTIATTLIPCLIWGEVCRAHCYFG